MSKFLPKSLIHISLDKNNFAGSKARNSSPSSRFSLTRSPTEILSVEGLKETTVYVKSFKKMAVGQLYFHSPTLQSKDFVCKFGLSKGPFKNDVNAKIAIFGPPSPPRSLIVTNLLYLPPTPVTSQIVTNFF